MSLSDCPKCWDTPCRCGYLYQDWSDKQVQDFIFGVVNGRAEYLAKKSPTVLTTDFFETIFLKDPTTLKPVKVLKVDTTPTGFIVYTKSGAKKWKHTIITEKV